MPVRLKKDKLGNYAQWGHHAKYYYTAYDVKSRKLAIYKATRQGIAAYANGYREIK